MKSLSNVGLGLTIVFGCLLLALVAELYYLLWWKRKFTSRETSEDYYKNLLYMFCFKKPKTCLTHTTQDLCSSVTITDTLVEESHIHSKDFLINNSMDSELMRVNSLSGPPRFLFTIVEETKEDLLESEDGKSRGGDSKNSTKGSRSRSLSDLLVSVETPYLTPLSSPSFFTPPLTPIVSSSSYSREAEFNKMRNSPPPRFKFLKDAEEKMFGRNLFMMESNYEGFGQDGKVCFDLSNEDIGDQEESFITIVVDKHKEDMELNNYQRQQQEVVQSHSGSTSSQVIPLDYSSPFTTCKMQPKYVNPSLVLHRS